MKYFIAAALLATTVAGFGTGASAAGGCGWGYHRGPYGGCRPNGEVVVVRRAPVVVVPRARVCPYGFVWAYGRCRPL